MQRDKVKAAMLEATRFIDRATKLLKAKESEDAKIYGWDAPKESGATRRASLDLTRALAEMRRP